MNRDDRWRLMRYIRRRTFKGIFTTDQALRTRATGRYHHRKRVEDRGQAK